MAPTTETLEEGGEEGSEDLPGIQKYSRHDLSAWISIKTSPSQDNLDFFF